MTYECYIIPPILSTCYPQVVNMAWFLPTGNNPNEINELGPFSSRAQIYPQVIH